MLSVIYEMVYTFSTCAHAGGCNCTSYLLSAYVSYLKTEAWPKTKPKSWDVSSPEGKRENAGKPFMCIHILHTRPQDKMRCGARVRFNEYVQYTAASGPSGAPRCLVHRLKIIVIVHFVKLSVKLGLFENVPLLLFLTPTNVWAALSTGMQEMCIYEFPPFKRHIGTRTLLQVHQTSL